MGKRRLKIGTFNLFNLAMPGERYYNRSYRKEEYNKKVSWISGQLNRMDADIVGFQEVFSKEALENVLAASGRYNGAHIKVSGRNGHGPAVALASRYKIEDADIIFDFPKEAVLDVDDIEIQVGYMKDSIRGASSFEYHFLFYR